ncbi:hypothetical protein VOLCADRAFT_67978 [Volvox carteri f. nagariensis]|uniref:PHD-type domain-containing protein n=1 Tax=Volvox carteri f. nagariensis TaxID=3068 RepID=D8UEW1_VOLCA|nr:uncharacterized protein VOLCADRAFT_67978 [Volvox carteri f. nagariensis]EFJ41710.1 hypothetical protein VOLCADRAFT_67978 [Volvox carteri f. nagariensis]|eukprot:XP_002957212.1 hypothetical protein VOLCADRAFT_67978 [Volvox carteri f. nagariensis]
MILPPAQTNAFDDGNTENCVLCGVGGSLICCDRCPAAYHLRCIGQTAHSIPDGDWLCPECAVGGRGKSRKGGMHARRCMCVWVFVLSLCAPMSLSVSVCLSV